MKCREFVEFIDRYIAGELSKLERFSFIVHMGVCRNCANYLRTYKQTIAASKAAFADLDAQVPNDVPEELVAAIMSTRKMRH
jgi:anti-sigma factor RsiW